MIASLLLSTVLVAGTPALEIQQCIAKHHFVQPTSDARLYTDYAIALAEVNKGNALFIDSRDDVEVEIDGALKIPRHHLKNKSFLKNKKLYLIHQANSLESLEQEIVDLQLRGFTDLSIVNIKQNPPLSISAKDVVINHRFASWLIISLDTALPKELSALQLDVTHSNAKKYFYRTASIYIDSNPQGKIVISAANPDIYKIIKQWNLPINNDYIYYLNGGGNAISSYLEFSEQTQYNQPEIIESCTWQDVLPS